MLDFLELFKNQKTVIFAFLIFDILIYLHYYDGSTILG